MRLIKLISALILLISFFFSAPVSDIYAQQNSSERVEIYVELFEDGSGKITERRVENIYDGTERYIVKENIGKSEIKDFTVTEDGRVYDFEKKWNIDASREDKMFKNGLIKTKNGYELAWGIGQYGRHEYVLEYTVTNMVKQLKDSQMLFWTFFDEDIKPESIYVEIKTFKPLGEEDESIWAFGYPGTIHFVDGKVVAQSDSRLVGEDQVIILVQFRNEVYLTKDKVNQNFDKIQKEAFKGSDYDTPFQRFLAIVKQVLSILGGILLAVVIFFLVRRYGVTGSFGSGISRRTFRRRYKDEYYRDYPYEGNVLDSYYFAYTIGLAEFKTIFTALLLKWIYENKIHIEPENGLFRKKSKIIFLSDEENLETPEGRLFAAMKRFAGEKKYVYDKQLSKWASSMHKSLDKWENQVMNDSTKKLVEENLLTFEESSSLFGQTRKRYKLTPAGEEMEKNFYKYVNYLHDYSLLDEHEAINVKIWDQMMIWAAFLNLTKVVMKQFEKIYPKYVEESIYKKDTIRRTEDVAEKTARKRRRAEQKARSSGKGGRASRGGGGGSYGGGGGGTR